MNCKHSEKNYCKLFEKQVTEGICKNCIMRLPKDNYGNIFGDSLGDFGDIFGNFINKNK